MNSSQKLKLPVWKQIAEKLAIGVFVLNHTSYFSAK